MAKEAGHLGTGKQEEKEAGWFMWIILFMFWDFHITLIWSYSFSSPNTSQIPPPPNYVQSLKTKQAYTHPKHGVWFVLANCSSVRGLP